MAQFDSITGDQPQSPKNKTSNAVDNKQNNVTEFNSTASKKESSPQPGSDALGTTGDRGTGAATATARSFYDQAKETAGQAYEAVTDKAATKLDEQKSSLTGGLTTVADSVRQVSENLGSSKTDSGLAETAAKYTDTAAKKIEDVAGYFETHSVRDMARDLEGFARRNPAVFFGAAFGLGLLAARFLKSTPPSYRTAAAGRDFAPSAGDTSHQLKSGSTESSQPDFTARRL